MRQVQVLHYDADPAHNGKAISCIVDHKGFNRQDIEMNKNMATVDLDIQFQPVAADKPQSFYNLILGEKKEILISFRAHPRPTQVFWTLYDKSEVMEGAESLNKGFTADVLQDGPNDGMFTARLTIAEVMEADAGSNNELSVTNELGTTKYPFTLSLGDRPASGEITTILFLRFIHLFIFVTFQCLYICTHTQLNLATVIIEEVFSLTNSQQSSEMQICTGRIISLLESFIGFPPPEFQTPVSLDE